MNSLFVDNEENDVISVMIWVNANDSSIENCDLKFMCWNDESIKSSVGIIKESFWSFASLYVYMTTTESIANRKAIKFCKFKTHQ